MQWEEKARWIKYEQNAEGGLQRWGKPHIAHMCFQSLIELKKKLEKGICFELCIVQYPFSLMI